MGRLTYEKENGEWGLTSYDIKKVPKGLYGALCKLHEYEKSGLGPDEVIKVNDFAGSQAALYLGKYQEYERLGVTLGQIREMDRLYAEKCREVAELRAQLVKLGAMQGAQKASADWKGHIEDRFLRVE